MKADTWCVPPGSPLPGRCRVGVRSSIWVTLGGGGCMAVAEVASVTISVIWRDICSRFLFIY